MSEINKYSVDYNEFKKLCLDLCLKVNKKYKVIYPIPKNGLFIANELSNYFSIPIENDLNNILNYKEEDILIVDDLIDSGKTLEKFSKYDKAVLFVKNNNENKVDYYVEKKDCWIQFPFEKEEDIEDNIIRILEYIGENPNREGLKDTPKRMVKSWNKLFGGYKQNIKDVITTFEDDKCDEMVVLKDIEFYSTCEHHFLPFSGLCHIAYIPDKKVIGVSKLARIMEVFARRLQIQERLTNQIADCIMKELEAKGVMIVIEAQHLCTSARGIEKQKSKMITSAIRGVFQKIEVRNEFLNLIRS